MSRNRIFVLALFLTALNLRPGITSVSPILNHLGDVLGMNSIVLSLLTSIPVLCMGVFSPVAVRLGHRIGSERALLLAMILVAFGTCIRLFTHSAWYLLVTTILLGVGIAIAGPLLAGFIKHHFPSKVSSMIGLYSVAMVIGASAGSGITVPMEHWFGGSWQISLAIWGVLAIIAIPILLSANRHPAASYKAQATQATASHALPWGSGEAWVITIFFGLMAFMFYVFTAWLPPIAQSMGWSATFAGTVSTVFTLVQIPVTYILPSLMHRFPRPRFWLILCSASELIGLVLIGLTSVNPIVAAIFMGIGAGGLFPLTLLLPINATRTPAEANSWSAMAQSIGYIIGAAGPLLIGVIHDATQSFSIAIGFLFVVVIAMLVMEVFVVRGSNRSVRAESASSKA